MSTATKAKLELVEKIGQLAADTGSSPEELTAALDDYRTRLDALRAAIDEGLSSLDRGEGTDGKEVFARLRAKYRAMVEREA